MLRVFRSKPKYVTVRPSTQSEQPKKEVPDNLWTRCDNCASMIYSKELEKSENVCVNCGFHFRLSAFQRVKLTADPDTFQAFAPLCADDPLQFPGYLDKVSKAQSATGLDDAIVIGSAQVQGYDCVLGVIDFSFIGGSMGSVVGEQLTRGFEYGLKHKIPVIVFSGGGGGARMHEGIFSLMQMAKTSQAVGLHSRAGLLFISILTHPTMGGIYASFASLGDIILAEPKALIGFAGPRIVEETTRQKLPSDFQTSEFALKHGMLDAIVERSSLKQTIGALVKSHMR